MDVITHVVDIISRGRAIKANGPIEHWLTTLATGFWGFDDSKEKMWTNLQKDDVLIFQSGPSNWDFVSKYKLKPDVSGFIGAGVVSHTSKKQAPRWLSEVIESRVHRNKNPKLWQNLVHFSDVIWFGDVNNIPAAELQELIENCITNKLDLQPHIKNLAANKLSFKAMSNAGFTCAPMGTGGRLVKRSTVLAELFETKARTASSRAYEGGSVKQPPLVSSTETSHASDYKCLDSAPPTKRAIAPTVKAVSKKGGIKNKDYLQEAADNQQLGHLGECIVFALEKQRVLNELGEEYAKQVTHVSLEEGDGAGYDIRTFRREPSGIIKKYLEVKTTTGDVNTPFFISKNELDFADAHRDQFEIVRVHSLNHAKHKCLQYRLNATDLLEAYKIPVNYQVHVDWDVTSTGD
jgi:hypothetical protein